MQRYLPLAILLILFGMKNYTFTMKEWMQGLFFLPIIFMLLLFFRLVDDLISRREDANQPNRIYTEKFSWTSLVFFTGSIFFVVTLFVNMFFSEHLFAYLLVVGISLLPYILRLIMPTFNFIFPLFKYGIIVLFLNSVNGELQFFDFVFSGVVFFGFLLYELLEDDRLLALRKHVKWMYWVLIIPFVFIYPNLIIWIGLLAISLYLFWLFKKPSYMHYCILLLVLSLKIIVYVV